MKLREWMKIWLERYVKSAVKSRTFTKYEQIVNLHINPYMGNCSMKKIKEMDVQKLLSVDLLANKKLSTSVINAVLSVLKNSLSIAVTKRLTDKSRRENKKNDALRKSSGSVFDKRTTIDRKLYRKDEEYEIIRNSRLPIYGIAYRRITCFDLGRRRYEEKNNQSR